MPSTDSESELALISISLISALTKGGGRSSETGETHDEHLNDCQRKTSPLLLIASDIEETEHSGIIDFCMSFCQTLKRLSILVSLTSVCLSV